MLATILSLVFVASVFATAISLDSHEQNGNDAPRLTYERGHVASATCQQNLDPIEFARFTCGPVPLEHPVMVDPLVERQKNGECCDSFFNDKRREVGSRDVGVSTPADTGVIGCEATATPGERYSVPSPDGASSQ